MKKIEKKYYKQLPLQLRFADFRDSFWILTIETSGQCTFVQNLHNIFYLLVTDSNIARS